MIFVNWLNGSFLVLTVLLTHFLVSRIESRVSYSYMFYMCQKLNISYISEERIHIKIQQLDYLKLKIKDLLLVLFYLLKNLHIWYVHFTVCANGYCCFSWAEVNCFLETFSSDEYSKMKVSQNWNKSGFEMWKSSFKSRLPTYFFREVL